MKYGELADENIEPDRAKQIKDNVRAVLDSIALAEEQAEREKSSVSLLAAVKTRTTGEIFAALEAGVRVIGENRPQEIEAKRQSLQKVCAEKQLEFEYHLIGQLQTNKINKVLPYVDCIESVDSLKTAAALSKRLESAGREKIGVLLEVNESAEATKSGCSPEEAFDLACEIAQIEGIELRGLMTTGIRGGGEIELRRCFSSLRELRDRLLSSKNKGTEKCVELSMGMSGDYKYAIAEGSTIVRLGTVIFGPRTF